MDDLQRLVPRHGMLRIPFDGVRINGEIAASGANVRLRDGDIIAGPDGGFAYYRDARLVSMPERVHRMLPTLFPRGLRNLRVYQGNLKNCTLLAALIAASRNRPSSIIELFTAGAGGDVGIAWRDGSRRVVLPAHASADKGALAGSDPGVVLLERAYGEAHALPDASITEFLDRGRSGTAALYAIFGKQPQLLDFPGWALENNVQHQLALADFFEATAAAPSRILGIAGTKRNASDSRGNDGFQPHHAYAIVKADPTRRLVILADLHNASQPIDVQYEIFYRNFRSITFVSR